LGDPDKKKCKIMSDFFRIVQPYLARYGYWAVFGAILLEDFGLPVPGETLLIASALLASQGHMRIVPLLLIACVAAVIGDNIGYGIGRFGGRRLVSHYGRYVLITGQRLNRAEEFFHKYGGAVVVMARFFAVLRQLNGIAAGTVKMSWPRFLTYNIVGAALWVGFWGMLFYDLGEKAARFSAGFNKVEFLLVFGVVAAMVLLVVHLLRRRMD
jgi:membrane protein DedA with SNARE-associated domain